MLELYQINSFSATPYHAEIYQINPSLPHQNMLEIYQNTSFLATHQRARDLPDYTIPFHVPDNLQEPKDLSKQSNSPINLMSGHPLAKPQHAKDLSDQSISDHAPRSKDLSDQSISDHAPRSKAVSYTHLTLPTSSYV